MSMQPPAAPHRVAIANIDIPFWRMVAILVKWSLAAIPATIILMILFTVIAFVIIGALGWLGLGNLPFLRGLPT
jgi:hypothetical protein